MLIPSETKRAKRPCARPGCLSWATHGSYCEKHYQEWQAKRQERIRKARDQRIQEADARRPNASQRGYNTAWKKARLGYLSRHPICVVCGKPATEVDHIIPHKGDLKLFWDVENWQSLCHECHSRKTFREVSESWKTMRKNKKPEKLEGIQPGDDMNIFYIK